MKLNRIITLCAMAATLAFSATTLFAQDNGNNATAGPAAAAAAAAGGGNWDPAQMQQRMMDRMQEQLGFTNDTDWDAVKPLVQKVMDARRDVGFGGMGGCSAAAQSRRHGQTAAAIARRRHVRPAQPGTGSVAKGA